MNIQRKECTKDESFGYVQMEFVQDIGPGHKSMGQYVPVLIDDDYSDAIIEIAMFPCQRIVRSGSGIYD